MERINRIGLHGFIFAVAAAMFIHSTWSINTIFGGLSPALESDTVRYILWVIPGMLLAFAIDIGQISTSIRITQSRTTTQRIGLGITFIVLALAGYYLQWFHLIHHMPKLAFGEGLSIPTRESVVAARDAAIFIIPALLPISMILYTLSNIGEQVIQREAVEAAPLEFNRPLDFLAGWKRITAPAAAPTRANGTVKIVESSSPEDHP
jgi:hypothetical protein